jgi:hypothetical protein
MLTAENMLDETDFDEYRRLQDRIQKKQKSNLSKLALKCSV